MQQSDGVRRELVAKLESRDAECARLRQEAVVLSEQLKADREAASRVAERDATGQQAPAR